MERPFTYEIDPDYDYVLEERGNTYTALRKIRWGDRDHFNLDIRKWYATEDGERMAKGCSLMSDEGANELTRVLISTGYGSEKELCDEICSGRKELAARIYDQILNDNNLKNELEDIIVNNISEEDDEEEYHNLKEVI